MQAVSLRGVYAAGLKQFAGQTWTFPAGSNPTMPYFLFAFGMLMGTLAPLSQRAGPSATKPWSDYVSSPRLNLPAPQNQRSIQLAVKVEVQPGSALINFANGRCNLGVQPVLDFFSRSPDGCWTLFATRRQREGPLRKLVGIEEREDALARCQPSLAAIRTAGAGQDYALARLRMAARRLKQECRTLAATDPTSAAFAAQVRQQAERMLVQK